MTNALMRTALRLGLSLPLLSLITGCDKQPEATAPPAAPPAVDVAKAQAQTVTPYDIFTGSLSANQYVHIRPQVAGFVASVNFKPGQAVKAGDILFKLDDRAAKAQFDQTTADLAVKKANLQNAEDELGRQERLQKQDATNEKDLLTARSNHRAATAAVESAAAALEAAKVNLDYHTIYSPIDGMVDVNTAYVGDLVSSANAKPLTTVANIDPIYADFSVPEEFIVRALRKRANVSETALNVPASISIGTEDNFQYPATVDFVSNTVSQSTGTIPVRATANNANERLYPGLFVRVKVNSTPRKDAVVVREDAAGRDIGGDFLWVIGPDNSAEKRYITFGPVVDQGRIVDSGLKAGETYVVKGLARVRERGKVTPKELSTTQPTTAPNKAE